MVLQPGYGVARGALLVVLAVGWIGCSDAEEEAGAGSGAQSCQRDTDCESDEWCRIEFGIEDFGTCEPLDPFASDDDDNTDDGGSLLTGGSNGATTDGGGGGDQNCLAATECPRGFECSGGRCVELGSGGNQSSNGSMDGTTGDAMTGVSNSTSGGCSGDAECDVSEECCGDGVCRARGQCDASTSDPVEDGPCSSGADCLAFQE